MKAKKNFETTIEVDEARYSWLNLDEWIKEVSTDAQRRAWSFAVMDPTTRSNVSLVQQGWGPTEGRSFTLTENTRNWLEETTKHRRRQSASKTVEVALCRYRMWPLLFEYIRELTTECRNAKRRVIELEKLLDKGVVE